MVNDVECEWIGVMRELRGFTTVVAKYAIGIVAFSFKVNVESSVV